MKNKKNLVADAAKKVAEKTLRRDANSTSCTTIFQPKSPADLKKFSKINKE